MLFTDLANHWPIIVGLLINTAMAVLLTFQAFISAITYKHLKLPYAKSLITLSLVAAAYALMLYLPLVVRFAPTYDALMGHATASIGFLAGACYLSLMRSYLNANSAILRVGSFWLYGVSASIMAGFFLGLLTGIHVFFAPGGPETENIFFIVRQPTTHVAIVGSLVFGLSGVILFAASAELLRVIVRDKRGSWFLVGIAANYLFSFNDLLIGINVLKNSVFTMSLAYVVEIALITYHYQKAAALRIGELEGDVVYLTRVAEAGFIVGNITHDIRNPLAIIAGSAYRLRETLKAKQSSWAGELKIIDKIDRCCSRIDAIIKHYLAMIHRNAGTAAEEVALNALVQNAIELCENKIDKAHIKVDVQVTAGLTVTGFENSITMCLVNLISNAADAVATLPERWIRVEARLEGSEVVVHVIDSGRGIPADLIERIFDKSFTTKRVGQGTGLGLAFVRQVMEHHRGRVYVNQKMANTCFTLVFPRGRLVQAA